MDKQIEHYIHQYRLDEILSEELLYSLTLHTYQKKEFLMRSGEELTRILFLVKGKASTGFSTRHGRFALHSFLFPMDLIGDVEVLHGFPIINDVQAVTDVECLSLCLRTHREQLCHDEKFLYYLSRELSRKLKNSNQNSSVSMMYPVENRLASYLIAASTEGIFQDNQQESASMIGCSYRQFQRTLQQFVIKGYLKKEYKGCYRLMNPTALEKLGEDVYILHDDVIKNEENVQ